MPISLPLFPKAPKKPQPKQAWSLLVLSKTTSRTGSGLRSSTRCDPMSEPGTNAGMVSRPLPPEQGVSEPSFRPHLRGRRMRFADADWKVPRVQDGCWAHSGCEIRAPERAVVSTSSPTMAPPVVENNSGHSIGGLLACAFHILTRHTEPSYQGTALLLFTQHDQQCDKQEAHSPS